MRSKENAEDYRYMPEPDVPPVELTDEQINAAEESMPLLPSKMRKDLLAKNIDYAIIDVLLESDAEYSINNTTKVLESSNPKQFANFVVNIEIPIRANLTALILSTDQTFKLYGEVISLLEENKLSSTNAKTLIEYALENNIADDANKIAEDKVLIQSVNEDDIMKFVDQVLSENPKAVEDIKSGQDKAIGFLVGQVMKLSQGKTNPAVAKKLLEDRIKTL